jgi:hypothetical protein
MKRCPQCEFIYEDDQSHCDMDGARLTHDSHPLPKLQALTTTRTEALTKSKWRTRVVPIIAALILTSVLGLVYFVSIRQSSRRSTAVAVSPAAESPANNLETSAPASNAVASPELSSETDSKTTHETKATTDTDNAREEPSSVQPDSKKSETTSSTKPTTIDRKPKTKPQVQNNTRPAAAVKPVEKKDSKVRSALRKTGRFLKKTLPL